MAIGLLNYIAAGAGQAMGHAADAAYVHWTDKDLQDQKDQAEAKKEARINEARIAARDEQAAYERSPQFKEDTANAVREGAINQTKADIEKSRMIMQEKTSPGTVELENKIKTDEAVGTTKAGLVSKDLITQHDQNFDVIKAQKDAELQAGTLEGRNKAEFERQRAMTPEGIKADNAAKAAARKLQAETIAKEAEGVKWTAEAGKHRAEAYAKAMEPDTKLIEMHTKALEQINNAMKEIPDEGEAKMALKEAYQLQVEKLNQAQEDAKNHHNSLLGIKEEPVNAGTMPPADTETSATPGGGSVPVVPAAVKPAGAINTEEKPKEPTPLKVDGMSQTQIMYLLANSKNLSPEQKAYLKKNSVFARFLTDDPKMVADIYESAGLNYERTGSEQEHYNAVEGQYLKGLSTEKKNAFARLTVQQKHKAVREAGYSTQ